MASLFSRALAGAADAGSKILNKYIDEEILQKRAQFLEDLKIKGMQRQEEYLQSDEVQGRRRENQRQELEMQNAAALKGEVAKATNPDLRQAKVDDISAQTPALADRARTVGKAEADVKNQAALDLLKNPDYIKGEAALARARHIESAGSLAQAALARLQIQNQQEATALRQQLADARAAGDENKVAQLQQRITDLAFTGKDTSGAYKAYTAASNKLIELETKLSTVFDPAEKQRIQAEIDESRAMARQAAKELGVKLPERQAPQPPAAAVDALQKNPQLAAQFDAKYGPGAAERALAGAGARAQPQQGGTQSGAQPSLMDRARTAAPVPQDPQARIAEIRKKLEDDDYIKQSFGGSAGRAIERRSMPLGVAARRDLEAELNRLMAGS